MASATGRGQPLSLRFDPVGFLCLEWTPGTHIDGAMAEDAMREVNTYYADGGGPLMVDMTATASLSRDARKVFARRCAASRIALVGTSAVDRVIANFALGVNSVPVPTKFFTSPAAAGVWLIDDH